MENETFIAEVQLVAQREAEQKAKEHTHDFDKVFGSGIGLNTCKTCGEKRWF